MSRHRSARPRYGRVVLAGSALLVTMFSVLAGLGLVRPEASVAQEGRPEPRSVVAAAAGLPATRGLADLQVAGPPLPAGAGQVDPRALPLRSGHGRRVVFDQDRQRVWLVRADDTVRRTYPVSGSLVDNLHPGTYAVYSRSRWAVGVDDSGVMEYFVRFTQGQHAAIGFHTIPTKLGVPLQTRAQLGTPQSHGCIRQATADAIAMWRFASIDTPVVVV